MESTSGDSGELFGKVAGNMVAAAHFTPFGHFFATTLLGMGAAGIKTATRGWIDRAWNFTLQLLRVPVNIRIQRWNRRQ
jgi:hypothetical protein